MRKANVFLPLLAAVLCGTLIFPRAKASAQSDAEASAESAFSAGEQGGFFDPGDDPSAPVYSAEGMRYGFYEDYLGGCSVWCAVEEYRVTASASSFLTAGENGPCGPENAIDGDRGTAWVEGAEGDGVGEYLEITRRYTVADKDYGVDFRTLCVVNGIARSGADRTAGGRVKRLGLYFNGAFTAALDLADTAEPQYFDLSGYHLHADSGAESVFRFTVDSVYPGEENADTALTGIEIAFWTPNH